MIISEKQVMQLMQIAQNSIAEKFSNLSYNKYCTMVLGLLDEINAQQSTELKEVK